MKVLASEFLYNLIGNYLPLLTHEAEAWVDKHMDRNFVNHFRIPFLNKNKPKPTTAHSKETEPKEIVKKEIVKEDPVIDEGSFANFALQDFILKNLREAKYETPTPIQQRAIPLALAGKDILGIAQTGTGKTAAFCLPIIHLLSKSVNRREPKSPKSLILTPTRELAIQIHQNLCIYGNNSKQSYAVIFGGVGQGSQVSALNMGCDVLVATPGRLLDLLQQKHLKLDKIEIFVLDEADRMLDMGFVRDIQKIIPLLPKNKHSLFFSATMPKEIQALANSILKSPQKVEVTPPATTAQRVQQHVMYVEKKDKVDLLAYLLKKDELKKTIVFVEMKHMANRIVEKLEKSGIQAAAIHGNKSQGARQKALQDFSSDRISVLVATDIAARGIDIDGISHVINFELSHIPESYVHRIGRTARAGTEGSAISLVSGEERSYLVHIEKTIRQVVSVDTTHPFHSKTAASAPVIAASKAKSLIEAEKKANRPASSRFRRPQHSQRNNNKGSAKR